MSEESKTSDVDYVHMNDGRGPKAGGGAPPLAIALQQQENAAAYDAHQRSHQAAVAAGRNRTARSGVHTRLAQVRCKDGGMLTVPDAYTTEHAYKPGDNAAAYVGPTPGGAGGGGTPQEAADLRLALDLQKVEQTGAGTAHAMTKMVREGKEDAEANEMRTARSGKAAYHPTRAKKT